MTKAICNTSPLLYLYRIGAVDWLFYLFDEVWVTTAVVHELEEGRRRGYDVPDPLNYSWLRVRDPQQPPFEWLAPDLGPGELSVIALALENPDCILLIDDGLARRIAQAAGLAVWGTLRVLLEAKARGWTDRIGPLLDRLSHAGMWLSGDIRRRILRMAGEEEG